MNFHEPFSFYLLLYLVDCTVGRISLYFIVFFFGRTAVFRAFRVDPACSVAQGNSAIGGNRRHEQTMQQPKTSIFIFLFVVEAFIEIATKLKSFLSFFQIFLLNGLRLFHWK